MRRSTIADGYQPHLASFKTWWEPYSCDEKTGASIGGQPSAWRWWVRPPTEEGRTKWERRQYGERAERAIKSAIYYECWKQWKLDGEPIGQWVQFMGWDSQGHPLQGVYGGPFISICLPVEQQAVGMGEIWKTIGEKQHVA